MTLITIHVIPVGQAVAEAHQHAPTSTEQAVSTVVLTHATTQMRAMSAAQTGITAKEVTPAPPKSAIAAPLDRRLQDAQDLAVASCRLTATPAIAIAIHRTRTHTHRWQLRQTTSTSALLRLGAHLMLPAPVRRNSEPVLRAEGWKLRSQRLY